MTFVTLFAPFIVLSLVHVVSEAVGFMPGRWYVKPLLMPALAFAYLRAAEGPNPLLLAALAFGWLGDIFLMIPDPEKTRRYFRPGLAAFLLGHLFYIAVFASWAPGMRNFPARGWLLFIVYAATGVAGYRLVGPHAGGMRKAILAYSVIIAAMGGAAAMPLGAARSAGVVIAMAGAFIFMVSDIINAYNKFAREIRNERVWTMSSYLTGQLLLVWGYLLL